ncbi:MAG: hypothetical protein ACLPUO_27950 [Streptosporangiaceae bacterium]|jgi:hypothetical protein
MRRRARLTVAAGLSAAAAVGFLAAGTPAALAVTPQCAAAYGAQCVRVVSGVNASYALGTGAGHQRAGQPVELQARSLTAASEDFRVYDMGTVNSLYALFGLPASPLAARYGPDEVVELQYAPLGSVAANLCVAAVSTPAAGDPVSLQSCSEHFGGLWVLRAARPGPSGPRDVLISFAAPDASPSQVLTDPASAHRTNAHVDQMVTSSLDRSGGAIARNQIWRLAGPAS